MYAFISRGIDYSNARFTRPLKIIQNSAAKVLSKTKRRDHISPILKSLHWHPISYRTDLKTFLLVLKSLKWVGPNCLHDMFKQLSQERSLRLQLPIATTIKPTVRTKKGKQPSASMASIPGTSFQKTSKTPQRSPTLKLQ